MEFLPYYSDEPGKIYTLDMLDPDLTPVALHIEGEFDQKSFNPHGISVFTVEEGMEGVLPKLMLLVPAEVD